MMPQYINSWKIKKTPTLNLYCCTTYFPSVCRDIHIYNNLIIGDLVKYELCYKHKGMLTEAQTLSRIVVGKGAKDNSGSME